MKNNTKREGKGEMQELQCRTCGTLAYRGDRFCSCCGTPMVSGMPDPEGCPGCRTEEVHPHMLYCTVCGERLGRERT